eukprot:1594264-Rhodomonas_salina.1
MPARAVITALGFEADFRGSREEILKQELKTLREEETVRAEKARERQVVEVPARAMFDLRRSPRENLASDVIAEPIVSEGTEEKKPGLCAPGKCAVNGWAWYMYGECVRVLNARWTSGPGVCALNA